MAQELEFEQIQDMRCRSQVPMGMAAPMIPKDDGCRFSKQQSNEGPFQFHFGTAIQALKAGKKVGRIGWNGKGMWLELSAYGPGAMYKDRPLHPHILMATAQGDYVPWLASQTDMLTEDWVVVNE